MKFSDFNNIVDKYKMEKPILFGLENDKIVSVYEIEQFEDKNKIEFPDKYKELLKKYGGGYFGYANVYSLDVESDFYVLKHNEFPIDKYLKIADNGCGDYYIFCVEEGRCLESLYFYEHDTGGISKTEYADIFEYLVNVGLKIYVKP